MNMVIVGNILCCFVNMHYIRFFFWVMFLLFAVIVVATFGVLFGCFTSTPATGWVVHPSVRPSGAILVKEITQDHLESFIFKLPTNVRVESSKMNGIGGQRSSSLRTIGFDP